MESSISNPESKNWQFSPLDAVLVGMVNRGSWLYNIRLDKEKLKKSLARTLTFYPIFAGRIIAPNTISANSGGVAFEIDEQLQYDCQMLSNKILLPKEMQAQFDLNACKNGAFPILSIKVTFITGGTLISVSVNHACADGATLFRFVADWSKIYNDEAISPLCFHQDLFPKPIHTKAELSTILKQKNWYAVGMKDLFSMLFDRNSCQSKIAEPLFISYEFLNQMRAKHSIGEEISDHSLICALLSRWLCKKETEKTSYVSVASVINLRGRAVYPKNFVGNAVMNVTSDTFSLEDGLAQNAALIQKNLKNDLQKESLETLFLLYSEAMTLKVPFLPFNLGGTYGKTPTALLINNFCSFHPYEISFGEAEPVRVYPNDLPDKIKIFPGSKAEKGIYLLLRGKLAENKINLEAMI